MRHDTPCGLLSEVRGDWKKTFRLLAFRGVCSDVMPNNNLLRLTCYLFLVVVERGFAYFPTSLLPPIA